MRRLVLREGFTVSVTSSPTPRVLTRESFESAAQVHQAARKAPGDEWAAFDIFYPMPESELRASTGHEIVTAILGGVRRDGSP